MFHCDKGFHFKDNEKSFYRHIFNKKPRMFGFSLVEFVLSGCRGGVERVQGKLALQGRPRGPETQKHVGKTISYSQMLSGHNSSYA